MFDYSDENLVDNQSINEHKDEYYMIEGEEGEQHYPDPSMIGNNNIVNEYFNINENNPEIEVTQIIDDSSIQVEKENHGQHDEAVVRTYLSYSSKRDLLDDATLSQPETNRSKEVNQLKNTLSRKSLKDMEEIPEEFASKTFQNEITQSPLASEQVLPLHVTHNEIIQEDSEEPLPLE